MTLAAGADTPLQETYYMNQIGNNDRGTLIVPDAVAERLTKAVNILLVRYKPATSPDAVLQAMLPIGLDDAHGYRYAEKTMMYDMFYGINALVTFLCCYIGIVFLLICAALLALKQLSETADNVYRYGLLQSSGPNRSRSAARCLPKLPSFSPHRWLWPGSTPSCSCARAGDCGGVHEPAYFVQPVADRRFVSAHLRRLFSCNLLFLQADGH